MIMMPARQPRMNRQRGAVLVVSMIILVVLTMLAMSGMDTAFLQEKMAGNLRDRNLAFEAAEAAISEACAMLDGTTKNAVDSWSGANGLFGEADAEPDYFDDNTWTSAQLGSVIPGVANEPRYIVKHVSDTTSNQQMLNVGGYGAQTGAGITSIFRITARGTGRGSDAPVYIRMHYGRQF